MKNYNFNSIHNRKGECYDNSNKVLFFKRSTIIMNSLNFNFNAKIYQHVILRKKIISMNFKDLLRLILKMNEQVQC